MVTLQSNAAHDTPQKQFMHDYNVAFAEINIDKILSMMTEDATWVLVGESEHSGHTAIRQALEQMSGTPATILMIDTILTEDGQGVASGTMEFVGSKIAFCDIYTFTTGDELKVSKLVSYGVDLPS